jgi:hypothetical protein
MDQVHASPLQMQPVRKKFIVATTESTSLLILFQNKIAIRLHDSEDRQKRKEDKGRVKPKYLKGGNWRATDTTDTPLLC